MTERFLLRFAAANSIHQSCHQRHSSHGTYAYANVGCLGQTTTTTTTCFFYIVGVDATENKVTSGAFVAVRAVAAVRAYSVATVAMLATQLLLLISGELALVDVTLAQRARVSGAAALTAIARVAAVLVHAPWFKHGLEPHGFSISALSPHT